MLLAFLEFSYDCRVLAYYVKGQNLGTMDKNVPGRSQVDKYVDLGEKLSSTMFGIGISWTRVDSGVSTWRTRTLVDKSFYHSKHGE